MPLRGHFHPPGLNELPWESVHTGWLHELVRQLNVQVLPRRYRAAAEVHFGFQVEADVVAFEQELPASGSETGSGNGVGVATAVWAPPKPTAVVPVDFRQVDLLEIRVVDTRRTLRVVAVLELVSPSNKDRQTHREAFVTKCASFLQQGVSVIVVDVVTDREPNLHNELTRFLHLEQRVPQFPEGSLYSVAYRTTKGKKTWKVEVWPEQLTLGTELPTMPLWLADNLVVPANLEASYEETRRVLRLS